MGPSTPGNGNPPKRWLVIANPAAGQGRVRKALPRLEQTLADLGVSYQLVVTSGPGEAKRWAERFREADVDLVAAVGGDGTVREVATGLLHAEVPLLVVPLGSGNDFSRVVNCDRPWLQVLRSPWKGTSPRWVDVGYAEMDHGSEVFVNGAGIGFDACVVENMPRFRVLKGDLWYLATVIYTFFGFRPPRLEAQDPHGQVVHHGPALLFSVGNGQYLGGGFHLFPRSRLDDGLLDISVVQPLSVIQFARKLPKVFKGTHLQEPEVSYHQLSEVLVSLERAYPIQMDGELPGRSRSFRFGLLPRALRVWWGCGGQAETTP